jgi:hypothetical protein
MCLHLTDNEKQVINDKYIHSITKMGYFIEEDFDPPVRCQSTRWHTTITFDMHYLKNSIEVKFDKDKYYVKEKRGYIKNSTENLDDSDLIAYSYIEYVSDTREDIIAKLKSYTPEKTYLENFNLVRARSRAFENNKEEK